MLVIIVFYFTKTSHMERGTWGTTNISTRILPKQNIMFPSKLYTYCVCVHLYVCIK